MQQHSYNIHHYILYYITEYVILLVVKGRYTSIRLNVTKPRLTPNIKGHIMKLEELKTTADWHRWLRLHPRRVIERDKTMLLAYVLMLLAAGLIVWRWC